MKKILLLTLVALGLMQSTNAQNTDKRVFNHLAVGLNAGTAGVGVDVAMPACRWVEIEAGFTMMPKVKYNTTVDINQLSYTDLNNVVNTLPSNLKTIGIEGKLNMVNGKVMFNILPFNNSNFHIKAGAYFGSGNIAQVYNKEDGLLKPVNDANNIIKQYNDTHPGSPQTLLGVAVGDDYLITPDQNGNASATFKTKSFKPYVGIGFGRAVPRKNRVGFMFDIGAMIWGKPQLQDHQGKDITKFDDDVYDVVKKITVYPVLNFRLCGRIF